jgi:SAM-dependent methyltransferase
MSERGDWFEEWFASDFYLKLYSHRDESEAVRLVDTIIRSTGMLSGEGRRALDLASGPGRHAIALARRGFDVTAVDLSRTLLDHSRAEAERAGVAIDFIESDMRAIEFDREFDLAVQLFTSFGYFEDEDDDRLVLHHMCHSLRDGAWYALDLMNPAWLERNLVDRNTRSIDGREIIEEREIIDGRVNKSITIPFDGSLRTYNESVRLYQPEQIDRMLRAAGFEPSVWHGDYGGAPFDPALSKRMLVISRRSSLG